ncbi:MAG TPA: aminotransferase class I/II-fold pyridoxal phosphate-dependent enzyme [Pseudomonas sp.]|uniref:pyoverdine biosynthesis transaminase PtaA n=1 Tax=Pseudomonas sp. TaxID=306 RepID=UPI002ED861A7
MTDFSRRHFVTAATLASLASALPAWAKDERQHSNVDPIFGDDVIRLDYNESPYGPCAPAVKAMELGARQSGRYYYEQQVRLIELFAEQNHLPSDHVAAFCGTRSPLQYALARYAGARSVVTAAPTYDSVGNGAEDVGAKVHEVPLDENHAHNVRGMLAADVQAGVIYLCNPNNPTGTLTPYADIEHLVSHKPPGCLAIIDEAYIHFSDAPPCLNLAVEHDNVMVLRTFSKLYGMAGARLGLAIAKPQVLKSLEILNGHNFISVSASLGAIASLKQSGLVAERKATNQHILRETTQHLQAAGYRCTDARANCFMIDLGHPAAPVIRAMAERGVRVGRVFEAWPNWMRVTVGTAEQMKAFLDTFFTVMQHA